jgi:hypothetical protein
VSIEPSWLLVGLVALQRLTLGYAYWCRSAPSDTAPSRHEGPDQPRVHETPDLEAGPEVRTVTCDHWGTENAAEYHFCRNCVADLRASGAGDDAPSAAFGSGSA